MKLDQIILGIVVAFGGLYLLTFVIGVSIAAPFGFLALIPIAIVVGILGVVIRQRLTNKEDDYYTKNVDK